MAYLERASRRPLLNQDGVGRYTNHNGAGRGLFTHYEDPPKLTTGTSTNFFLVTLFLG